MCLWVQTFSIGTAASKWWQSLSKCKTNCTFSVVGAVAFGGGVVLSSFSRAPCAAQRADKCKSKNHNCLKNVSVLSLALCDL